MKKLLLILALCFTMVNCSSDKNKKQAVEMITLELESDLPEAVELTKLKLEKVSDDDERWEEMCKDRLCYYGKASFKVNETVQGINPGDLVRTEILVAFNTDDEGMIDDIARKREKKAQVKRKDSKEWIDL